MAVLFPDLDLVVTMAPGTGSTALEAACTSAPGSHDVASVLRVRPDEADPKHATWTRLRRIRPLVDVTEIVTATRDPFDFYFAEWFRLRTRWADERADPTSWVHRTPGTLESIDRATRTTFDEWVRLELEDTSDAVPRRINRGHVDEATIVVRMEHVDADLRRLAPRLARRIGPLPRRNTTSRPRDLGSVYDADSARLVARAHRDDIAMFGYTSPI